MGINPNRKDQTVDENRVREIVREELLKARHSVQQCESPDGPEQTTDEKRRARERMTRQFVEAYNAMLVRAEAEPEQEQPTEEPQPWGKEGPPDTPELFIPLANNTSLSFCWKPGSRLLVSAFQNMRGVCAELPFYDASKILDWLAANMNSVVVPKPANEATITQEGEPDDEPEPEPEQERDWVVKWHAKVSGTQPDVYAWLPENLAQGWDKENATTDIREAHRFTKEEAVAYACCRRFFDQYHSPAVILCLKERVR